MAFDKNNNGVISNKNLIHALRRVGLNPTEVREDFQNKNHQTYCYFFCFKLFFEQFGDFLDAIASLGLGVTLTKNVKN